MVKCDQEPSIVEVQEKIMKDRADGCTVPENSPVGESQANGLVENTIKRVQGQIRTIKDHFESNIKAELKMEHPVFEWLMDWAAAVLNRYVVDASGRTPYFVIKGRNSKRPIAMFGERVLYMPLKLPNNKPAKLDMKMKEGIWLGLKWRSG